MEEPWRRREAAGLLATDATERPRGVGGLPRLVLSLAVAAGGLGTLALAARGGFAPQQRPAGFRIDAVTSLSDGGAGRLIRWKDHPDKCMDVWGDHAGAMIQLWSCDDFSGAGVKREAEFKWILPPEGVPGAIVWAGNASYCLNAPSESKLQLWYCDTAPPQHTRWKVTRDGRIHLAYAFGKCLDIPNGEHTVTNGVKLQLWDCMLGDKVKEGNTEFSVYAQDCEWSPWSAWSACSLTCGGGVRYQARRYQAHATKGGSPCMGSSTRSSSCSNIKCLPGLGLPHDYSSSLGLPHNYSSSAAGLPFSLRPAGRQAEDACPQQGRSWAPVSMDGHDRSVEATSHACQVRCAKTGGCRHFSWWPDGGCHLQDFRATARDAAGVWSGPPVNGTHCAKMGSKYTV